LSAAAGSFIFPRMNQHRIARCLSFAVALSLATFAMADSIPLGDLGVDKIKQEWGKPAIDKSIEGHPLTIDGHAFDHGIGTHASSILWIDLGGHGERFTANVGLDDEVKSTTSNKPAKAKINFEVVSDDNKVLFKSGPMKLGDPAKPVDVDLHDVQKLLLLVEPVGDFGFCHADWADATITYADQKPTAIDAPPETVEVLTPPAPPTPRINGAAIYGVRPTHPVLFTIAATGDRPMTFSVDHSTLPLGVAIDPKTGQLSGSIAKPGEYILKLHATNSLGTADRELKIEVGDKIALTPQMGWNSWNCFASAVSDEKVRAAADAMVNSGLINHGWTYINIDDCWEIPANRPADQRRAPDGHILTNKKFPDMKALADYIHSKGLRAGLYSSPGPSTCGGYTASYKYEEADAKQYAAWGFDYLKYDWCSYGSIANAIKKGPNPPTELELLEHPYSVMGAALMKQDRDILFSFCQYGMGDVWTWGESIGGNSWRTTGDINDSWGSMSGIGFNQNGHEKYAGPGHWNDPDMLVVGKVGWGHLHPSKLTPNEQYTHITLWCLLDSPLLIGCDMTQMDPFTLGLLTNDEVIAVNQDPLGKQAARIVQNEDGTEIWAKDMADGSKAVGLFNRNEMPSKVTVKWSDLGLTGTQKVRDLWRQKDVDSDPDGFTTEVGRHGAFLIKVSKP
jgi:alpha-galactosidase